MVVFKFKCIKLSTRRQKQNKSSKKKLFQLKWSLHFTTFCYSNKLNKFWITLKLHLIFLYWKWQQSVNLWKKFFVVKFFIKVNAETTSNQTYIVLMTMRRNFSKQYKHKLYFCIINNRIYTCKFNSKKLFFFV